jgi:hypothetical protein
MTRSGRVAMHLRQEEEAQPSGTEDPTEMREPTGIESETPGPAETGMPDDESIASTADEESTLYSGPGAAESTGMTEPVSRSVLPPCLDVSRLSVLTSPVPAPCLW